MRLLDRVRPRRQPGASSLRSCRCSGRSTCTTSGSLRDMLRHAYHWRLSEDSERPVYRYVLELGPHAGDAGVLALEARTRTAQPGSGSSPPTSPGSGSSTRRRRSSRSPSSRAAAEGHPGQSSCWRCYAPRTARRGYSQVSLSAAKGQGRSPTSATASRPCARRRLCPVRCSSRL